MSVDHSTQTDNGGGAAHGYRTLRVWIPICLLALMAVARFVPGMIEDAPANIWMVSAFGPMLGSLGLLLWWMLLSRAKWSERFAGLLGLVAIVAAVVVCEHPSMRGPLVIVMTIPMGVAAFAVGLVWLSQRLNFSRTTLSLGLAALAAGCSILFQNYGTRGDFAFELDWRWTPSPEQKFLAEKAERSEPSDAASQVASGDFDNAVWPGFRGPHRDGIHTGAIISADWTTTPPTELWRTKVGPAWSSFAVAGDYLFTQEQRGDKDAVVCYRADNGQEVWASSVTSRFFEALGGLGPRATPTVAHSKIYAMSAEGYLRCLQASDGVEVWSQDLRQVAQCAPPMWGFSSSPLVTDSIVAVHAGGDNHLGVVAFDAITGELAWSAPSGKQSYSSFQVVKLLGKKYLALLTDQGAQLIDPSSGQVAVDYAWKHSGYRALQPQVVAGNRLLIPTGMGTGTRLIQLSESVSQPQASELWTSRKMKPDFNDLVVHNGFIYGFDNQIFACVDLENGEGKWKGGRYGKGQVVCLADSDLLLVVAESGELVLLRANPERHEELAKLPALSGKTWNHPVVVGDRLFLRNAEEAVCYQLPTTGTTASP